MNNPLYPSLYQINTRALLHELGRSATLDDIPDATLDEFAASGFDWVWFLGIWQTGPMAREASRAPGPWWEEYRRQLPDLTDKDVCGSPFAVQNYVPHTDFGGRESLLRLRERLARRGLRLLLDFVPNHTAPDHPWRFTHPEFYVRGDEDDLRRDPRTFCKLNTRQGERTFARGRDPYFPAWRDVLQLNYRHAGLRAAMTDTLLQIAELCDGVRCDMAMLVLPEIFARTWAHLSWPADGTQPVDEPFWRVAVNRVRRQRPDFLFMAEVYWDLEWELQQEGFDYTYDKRLYDRLRERHAAPVRMHLWADHEFQRKSVRFLENHDEPRAAATFALEVHRAAAVATFFAPGMRFFHEGQFEGRRSHVSMHLCRRPAEPPDAAMQQFYARLLEALKRPEVRDGTWRLCDCRPAWDGNPTWDNFLAYVWDHEGRRLLVTVNYGPTRGQCQVLPPRGELRGRRWLLRDLLGDYEYDRDGTDLADHGLYLDLPAWGHHVFEMTPL